MNSRCVFVVSGLVAALLATAPEAHADFPVDFRYGGSVPCSISAGVWSIDPVSGAGALALDAPFVCDAGALLYPTPVLTVESSGSLAIAPASVTGSANISIQLVTGLSSATSGLICEPDGVEASFATVNSGWTAPLCSGCGAGTARIVNVSHTGGSTTGSIRFKAKCTYSDARHPRITTVLYSIVSSSPVTVVP